MDLSGRPPLIAVVDDDEDVRTAIDGLLSSVGYSTVLFESADALLTAPAGTAFDCIISDLQMPGTNGLQLARRLRSSGVPLVLITAYPKAEVHRQASAAGVRHLLVKPFDSNDLLNALEDLLER